jgi:chemotaxis protein methyltransferase CheR
MPAAKLPMVQSRLIRRVRELGLHSVDEYLEFFFNSRDAAEERIHLIDAITTHKTDFFREPVHFDYLTAKVLPAFRRVRPFRVWSAGCSSGEEPYTLAMVLSEFAASNQDFDYSITATDISTRMLEQSLEATYPESVIAPVAPALRSKYWLRSKDSTSKLVRIVPALRRKVTFEKLNFMDSQYNVEGGPFDSIFFRNVMIYFDRPTQEAVINRLCRHLTSGGHLFVGHSESLAGMSVPLAPAGPAIYHRA